jgi:D-alanyl-D-alanine carboxypeptidase
VELALEKEEKEEAVITFPPPSGIAGLKARFGSFDFHELSGGNVCIDGPWPFNSLIVLHNVCGTGHSVQLHHLVAPWFEESLRAAMSAAPGYPVQMLGGFCARHKMHDPSRDLSVHSWGVAWDVNWNKNPVGKPLRTDIPLSFVSALTSRGWVWGGSWVNEPDPMHFQFATGV